MTSVLRNIISLGYGRHLFKEGNAERVRMEICAKEVDSFHMVIFTSAHDGLVVSKGEHGLILHPTNSRARFLMPLDAFLIARQIIKKYKGDVLITTQDPFEPGLVGIFLKYLYRTPLVVQEHGDVLSTTHWRQESIGNYLRYFLGFFVLRRADLVRVVSSRTRQAFEKNSLKHISQLPVAIDTSSFLSATPDTDTRALFEAGTFMFLTVARFVPQKNLTLLLKAFEEVYRSNQNVRLLIVGSGEQEAHVKEYIKTTFAPKAGELPVVILPWSNNVAGMMKAVDAYVLTSNYEGWARVLIEAMVCQLPIVTTDVGCAGEVVIDGTHGLVVPVENEAILIKGMSAMASDSALYNSFKNNLTKLNPSEIPGTDISQYGVQWVHSLKI